MSSFIHKIAQEGTFKNRPTRGLPVQDTGIRGNVALITSLVKSLATAKMRVVSRELTTNRKPFESFWGKVRPLGVVPICLVGLRAVDTFDVALCMLAVRGALAERGFPDITDILPEQSSRHSGRVTRLAAGELVHRYCEDDHHADHN